MPRYSGSRSPARSRSRRSRSPSRRDSRSRSASRRRSSSYRGGRGGRDSGGGRRSRDFYDSKTNAPPNRCIGVFGLSLSTREETLVDLFDRYPGFESVKLVKEFGTGRSRGFAFITYETKDDAAYVSEKARDKCNGLEVDGHQIRIDFSASDLRGRRRSPPRYRRPRSRSRSYGRRRSYSRSPRRR